MTVRVVVLDDYQRVAESMADWGSLSPDVEVSFLHEHLGGPTQVIEGLQGFDAVCLMRERTALPATVIEALPQLRLIVTTGMANASVDVEVAGAAGIPVCGTGGSGPETAEHAWLLIATLLNGFLVDAEGLRRGEWQTGLGRRLEGATLGLLGLGNVGARVARYAGAFGMRLLAWSENLTVERAGEHGASLTASLDDLFERSDIVSVHLKLSERTRGLVTGAQLGRLGSEGFLVNTSRGPIVAEADLIAALQGGTIAGAGLDTFDVEPLPVEHPFRSEPRVLATPHTAYVSQEAYTQMYPQMLECVAAWLAGAPIRQIN